MGGASVARSVSMAGELASIWWGLILLGLCAGVLSGALGLGSGTVLIPGMVILFAFPQKSAQGAALAVMVPMALLGAMRYWYNPDIEVNFAAVGLIVAGALVGSLIGTELAGRVPGHVLKKVFAVFLAIVAVKMLVFSTPAKKPEKAAPVPEQGAALIEKGSAHDDAGS